MSGDNEFPVIERGWWTLSVTGIDEMNDADREHVAKLVREGYVSGELLHEDESELPNERA